MGYLKASQRNIGKRCYIKSMELVSCPFFPAHPPFKIIGAQENLYLVEGPWTSQVRFSVKTHALIVPKDQDATEMEDLMGALE